MTNLLILLLVFSLITMIFPPKKPNFLYGYQLGNAKKSLEHWRVANYWASRYLILLYSAALAISFALDYQNFDGGLILLCFFFLKLIIVYIMIEHKLKEVDVAAANNDSNETA